MKLLSKLGLTAGAAFPCCLVAFYLFRSRVSSNIKSTRIYEEAIETLRQHRGAIYLLGQPIVDSTAEFNSMGVKEKKQMDVKIRVSGPKSKGVLFYSTAADEKHEIQLDSVQLQVGSDDTRRLVIKKSMKEISSNSSNNETTNSSSNDKTTNGFSNDETKSDSSKLQISKTFPDYSTTNSSLKRESSSSENS